VKVMRYAPTIAALLLLVLVVVAPTANAMYVGIVVGGGKVSITYTAVVHLTGVPEDVIGKFKYLETVYSAIKPTIDYHLQQLLQDWLRNKTGLHDLTIEYLSTEFDYNEGYKTYTAKPSDVSVDIGNVEEGAVERLSAPDDVAMVISSTYYNNSNMIVVYLYFPIRSWHVPTNVKYINITIRGHLSRLLQGGGNAEASIAVYNYETGEYDVLRYQALNTDTPTTVSIPVGGASSYALGRTVIVRIRVIDYGSEPITLYLDYAKVDYVYYQADIKVGIDMTVSGVSRWSLEGRIYNLKFRYMAPVLKIETPYGITILVNTALFLNWSCFNVPLDKYEVKFNGTHTVFRLRVENVTLPTFGGWRVWIDPEQEIVALGFARVVGYDEIAVYEPWMLAVGAVIGLILFVSILKAIARAIATAEDVFKSRRRFVVRRP